MTDGLNSTATGLNGLNSGYLGLQSSVGSRLITGSSGYNNQGRAPVAKSID